MIKRWFLAVCLILVFPFAAYADLLVEPQNDFYTRHSSDCTHLGRSFYANGEQGFLSLKKEPGSKSETAAILNGEIIHIMFTYNHKGDIWGVTEIYTPDESYDKWPNGWVPMSELLLVYDYISFAEEHQDEFYTYTGNYNMLYETEDIVFWTWPGSGEKAWVLENEWRNSETDSSFLQASHAYKDADGREWGFFGYVYGNRNSWVCLSDPGNADIPAFNPAPQPELWQTDNINISANGLSTPVLIVILVAVLVACTMMLIRVFWKHN